MKTTVDALKRHPFALVGGGVLLLLYGVMLFAEFLAPLEPDDEWRRHSYAPPTRIYFFDAEGNFSFRPFFYQSEYTFDHYRQRVYREERRRPYYLRLFAPDPSARLWGVFPLGRRLVGTTCGEGRFYLLGADMRGRDLFSRILYGSRVSLTIGFVGVAVSTLVGVFLGGLAGYVGGMVDGAIMRLTEVVMMIPGFYLLLGLRVIFPMDMPSSQVYFMIVFILSFIGWAGMSRIIRGMAKAIREEEYVQAAQAMGQHPVRIILRHIIPQTFSYLVVTLTISIPGYIIFESSLSFLGLGIQDPQVSWGLLLSDAMDVTRIAAYPWLLIPGFFILITVMAYNFLGDALRDVLDPHGEYAPRSGKNMPDRVK
ncbi:ABC transporter permease [Chitinivibrio alkaliphilus]|uniref:Oligopeptide transport system permease protein AppC n=1 Tax=Chitinivibrio alkaliphilus ACht1 TaxID=1313304 RepID=U7D8I6_9BACT|nr:ABC transporter permease [Chitinivibrio alkaliphilus]ERP38709.1 oligopeptide transport system permease protein AppC [Chitinivibrio alkaliphilus ACht1]